MNEKKLLADLKKVRKYATCPDDMGEEALELLDDIIVELEIVVRRK